MVNWKIYLFIVLIIILDLLTKFYFQFKNFTIIPKLLLIKYSENPGLIFGLFSGNNFFVYILPIIVIGLLVYLFIKETGKIKLFIGFIIVGLIGNLISRIIYGYVIDFIFVPIYPEYNISLFNFADFFVVLGVVLVLIYSLKRKNKREINV